jgi:hypothetical protein
LGFDRWSACKRHTFQASLSEASQALAPQWRMQEGKQITQSLTSQVIARAQPSGRTSKHTSVTELPQFPIARKAHRNATGKALVLMRRQGRQCDRHSLGTNKLCHRGERIACAIAQTVCPSGNHPNLPQSPKHKAWVRDIGPRATRAPSVQHELRVFQKCPRAPPVGWSVRTNPTAAALTELSQMPRVRLALERRSATRCDSCKYMQMTGGVYWKT